MACSWDRDANIARAEKLVREAAAHGANIILLQELFETPYFCKDHRSAAPRAGAAAGRASGSRTFPRGGARTGGGAADQRVRARQ